MGLHYTILEQWQWAFSENNSCSSSQGTIAMGLQYTILEQWQWAFSENNTWSPSQRTIAVVLLTSYENSFCGPANNLVRTKDVWLQLHLQRTIVVGLHITLWEQKMGDFNYTPSENNSCGPSHNLVRTKYVGLQLYTWWEQKPWAFTTTGETYNYKLHCIHLVGVNS
jgi:hypothetical protein